MRKRKATKKQRFTRSYRKYVDILGIQQLLDFVSTYKARINLSRSYAVLMPGSIWDKERWVLDQAALGTFRRIWWETISDADFANLLQIMEK